MHICILHICKSRHVCCCHSSCYHYYSLSLITALQLSVFPQCLSVEPLSNDHNNTKWHQCKKVITWKRWQIWIKKSCLYFVLQMIYPTTSLNIVLVLWITLYSITFLLYMYGFNVTFVCFMWNLYCRWNLYNILNCICLYILYLLVIPQPIVILTNFQIHRMYINVCVCVCVCVRACVRERENFKNVLYSYKTFCQEPKNYRDP
jgi:hypothetical protein